MNDLGRAVVAVQAGAVILLPTETVYGLACAPVPEAVERLVEMKRRPPGKHLQLLVPDASWLARVGRPDGRATALAEAFWPGPLTLVVPAGPASPAALDAPDGTIGVRVPGHPVALDLLTRAGPLAASSANLSGDPTPTTAAAAARPFGDALACVLDGGPIEGRASTVVAVGADGVQILREGDVSRVQVEEVLGGPI